MISRRVVHQGPPKMGRGRKYLKWGEEENIVASVYIIKCGYEEYEDYLEYHDL